MSRYALFVTGAPATGKTTVVEFLARELPEFARIEKDVLKEALFATFGDGAASRQLSDAAIGLLWTIAPRCPRVIVEANFRTQEPAERERFRALDAKKIEVNCWCPLDEARRRFAERAQERHPAHSVKELTRESYEESAEPFGMGPVIRVDTTKPVDLPRVLEWVRMEWPTGR
jgi:predicted kinase